MDKDQSALERQVVSTSLNRIADFVQSEPFRILLSELYDQPAKERPKFVEQVILNEAELARRGVQVPQGLIIQRSAFKDQRPTLFCVTEKTPKGSLWEKTTFTFDNEASAMESS